MTAHCPTAGVCPPCREGWGHYTPGRGYLHTVESERAGADLYAVIARLQSDPVHYFDCERFNVTDYGTRQGKCDCTAAADVALVLARCGAPQPAPHSSGGVS